MLDGKILSAVLATLTAVAVSTTGGADLSDQGLETNPSDMEMDVLGLFKNPVGQLKEMITTTPKPETDVRAELVSENMGNETFQVKNARISPDNTTQIKFGTQKISSDDNIIIHGFSGAVEPSNSTIRLSGTGEGVLTSDVNISGTSTVENRVNSRRLMIEGVEESSISLSSVHGNIQASDASTSFDSERTLTIDSFSGDIVLDTGNSSIILDGKVNSLSSGDFDFGN